MTVVEAAPQVLTPLDPELAVLVEAELVAHGVDVVTGAAVTEVTRATVVLADGRACRPTSSSARSACVPTPASRRWRA